MEKIAEITEQLRKTGILGVGILSAFLDRVSTTTSLQQIGENSLVVEGVALTFCFQIPIEKNRHTY